MSDEKFDFVEWVQNLEYGMVKVAASTSLWLAPTVPAVMTFYSLRDHLGFHWTVALSSAAVAEFFNVTSMDTIMSIRKYNRLKSAAAPEQKSIYAWVAFGAYVTIILVVNVVTESVSGAHWSIVLSKLLLCLFSPVAGLLLSTRSQLSDLIEEYPLDKIGRKLKREQDKVRLENGLSEMGLDSDRTVSKNNGHKPDKTGQARTVSATRQDYVRLYPDNDLTDKEIADKFQVTDRTARRWIKQTAQEIAQKGKQE